jgi:hypothetical protein
VVRGERMLNKPTDAGPAWDALQERGLNSHREDIVEETRRSGAKTEWSKSHREDPRYPDARAREESAIATLVVKASLLADEHEANRPDAELGAAWRRRLELFREESVKARREKATSLESNIVKKARALLLVGSERRGIAGTIASSLGVTGRHVRGVLRKNGI